MPGWILHQGGQFNCIHFGQTSTFLLNYSCKYILKSRFFIMVFVWPYKMAFVRSNGFDQILVLRKRNALPITDTELKLIAPAAIMGDSNNPKIGYNRPAAIGTPSEL